MANIETATLGGGALWCLEAVFKEIWRRRSPCLSG